MLLVMSWAFGVRNDSDLTVGGEDHFTVDNLSSWNVCKELTGNQIRLVLLDKLVRQSDGIRVVADNSVFHWAAFVVVACFDLRASVGSGSAAHGETTNHERSRRCNRLRGPHALLGCGGTGTGSKYAKKLHYCVAAAGWKYYVRNLIGVLTPTRW